MTDATEPTRTSPTASALGRTRPRHALTVDVEDWFQVQGFEPWIDRKDWDSFPSRVEASTRRLLEMFAAAGARGTFFVLGWTAERFPHLVREIQAAGHEIASHSYWHRRLHDLQPQSFREDLRRSKDLLEQQAGLPVTMFRAPSFSVTAETIWGLEVLAEEGFTVDSSVFPIRHDRYGIPSAPRLPHYRETPSGRILEVPPATLRVLGTNLPIGGGGYFRLLPTVCLAAAWRAWEREQKCGGVFYLHPWEIDPGQPSPTGPGRLRLLRHRLGLGRAEGKLRAMLQQFSWGTLSEVLADFAAASTIATEPIFASAPASSEESGPSNQLKTPARRGHGHAGRSETASRRRRPSAAEVAREAARLAPKRSTGGR